MKTKCFNVINPLSRSANEFSRDFYLRDDVIALDLGEDGPEKVGVRSCVPRSNVVTLRGETRESVRLCVILLHYRLDLHQLPVFVSLRAGQNGRCIRFLVVLLRGTKALAVHARTVCG